MKTLLIILFSLACIHANATDHYFSNAGNDASGGTIGAPWRTINKFNITTFSAGDRAFFNRGDVFNDAALIIHNSGTVASPITIGAYGTGADPVISGLSSVTSWTNLGGNIWESTSAVSTLSTCNMVVINGVSTPMGRWPNADASYPYFPNYYIFQSITGDGTGSSSITSSNLSGTPNWTGANVVLRVNQWTLDNIPITSQSGGTIHFTGGADGLTANWGFFIQNDSLTLDQQNEWYYNPSTKKLRIYSSASPTNVQVSTIDTLVQFYSNIPAVAAVNIDHIQFQGGNTHDVWISGNLTFSITNCNISYAGMEGLMLYGGGIVSGTVDGSTFSHNGASAIYSTGTVNAITFTNNSVNTSGIISAIKANMYSDGAVKLSAAKSLIQYNTIDSSDYSGIEFRGDSVKVVNNLINHSAMIRGDAAGIYTGFASETGKVIDGNIVLNSQGNPRGSRSNDYFAMGIYIDDQGTDILITNNTIINARTGGIYLHNSNNLTVRSNTIYNCGSLAGETMWANGGVSMDANASLAGNVHDNIFNSNKIFALTQYQYAMNYYAESGSSGEVSNFGIIDSNYYVKINNDSTSITSQQTGITGAMSLSAWQTASGKDAHSHRSAAAIANTSLLRYEYNATGSPKTVNLDALYTDVTNAASVSSVTLPAYGAGVYIYTGALNVPPNVIIKSSLKRIYLK